MPKVIRDLTRLIRLTYLQSVQVTEGDRQAQDFTAVGQNFSGTSNLLNTTKKPKLRASLQSIVNTLFPYTGAFNGRKNSDSGWVIASTHNQTYWDIISWRIGIRDVGLNSFQFAEKSAVVTIPITSPKPIWKATIQVDEIIPQPFSPTKAWISYYLTADNGQTWHRINPLGKPTRFNDDGSVVPKIVTFNSTVRSNSPEQTNVSSNADVTELRLKIEMSRDLTVSDSDRLSPVLRGYKLLLYPLGGLSGSQDPTK